MIDAKRPAPGRPAESSNRLGGRHRQNTTARRGRLVAVPDHPVPEPEVPDGFPPAPRDTRHEWLVSWYWPNNPDDLRRRMFHTREAAVAYRDRIERQVRDADDVWKPGPQVIVRIDVRDVLPWREVG